MRKSHRLKICGQRWIRTTEGVSQQIYSLPHLATLVFAQHVFLKEEMNKSSLLKSGRRGSNPRPSAWKANALSTELLPQFWWAKMDSNHRRRKPADLQSAPFGHSGICPFAFEMCHFDFVSEPFCLTSYLVFSIAMQRYGFFLNLQIFCEFFSKKVLFLHFPPSERGFSREIGFRRSSSL